jgi:hypothetical protein
MTNSTAPIFMETIDKLGAGHLFGLAEDSKPSLAGSSIRPASIGPAPIGSAIGPASIGSAPTMS